MTIYVMPPTMNIYEVHDVCNEVSDTLGIVPTKVNILALRFTELGNAYGVCVPNRKATSQATMDNAVQDAVRKGRAVPLAYLPEVGHYHDALGVAAISSSRAVTQTRVLRKAARDAARLKTAAPGTRRVKEIDVGAVAADEALANVARAVRDSGGRMSSEMRAALKRSVARRKTQESANA